MEVKGVPLPAGRSFVVRRREGNTLPRGACSGIGNTTSVDPTSNLSFRLGVPALPLTGTYTVLITPASNTTGSIQFTLWKDVKGSVPAGTPPQLVIKFCHQQAPLPIFGSTAHNLSISL